MQAVNNYATFSNCSKIVGKKTEKIEGKNVRENLVETFPMKNREETEDF